MQLFCESFVRYSTLYTKSTLSPLNAYVVLQKNGTKVKVTKSTTNFDSGHEIMPILTNTNFYLLRPTRWPSYTKGFPH